MKNFREVNDDILKSWINFREEEFLGYLSEEDKKHQINFDEICERILKNVPKKRKKYVMKQLNLLDRNYINYVSYWNEKYYRNGFVDGMQIIVKCFNK